MRDFHLRKGARPAKKFEPSHSPRVAALADSEYGSYTFGETNNEAPTNAVNIFLTMNDNGSPMRFPTWCIGGLKNTGDYKGSTVGLIVLSVPIGICLVPIIRVGQRPGNGRTQVETGFETNNETLSLP